MPQISGDSGSLRTYAQAVLWRLASQLRVAGLAAIRHEDVRTSDQRPQVGRAPDLWPRHALGLDIPTTPDTEGGGCVLRLSELRLALRPARDHARAVFSEHVSP